MALHVDESPHEGEIPRRRSCVVESDLTPSSGAVEESWHAFFDFRQAFACIDLTSLFYPLFLFQLLILRRQVDDRACLYRMALV